jgi:multiple sugar transport system permease protein
VRDDRAPRAEQRAVDQAPRAERRPVDRAPRDQPRAAWLLVSPALTAMVLFLALPVLAALVMSLTDFDIYAVADLRNTRFVGLENYSRLLADPLFWKVLRNTLVFVAIGVPLTLAASLGGALLVHSRLARLPGLYRTIFYAPVVTTLVAAAVVFRYLFHPRYGLIDRALGVFGLPAIDWLGDPRWATVAITLLSVWRSFGYGLVIFVAGLQAIPRSLYEAAEIDGAGGWRQLRQITLPLLRPTSVFVAILTTVGLFQIFAEPYVMTRGGPLDATTTITLLMYEQGFRWWNMGRAAAIAFVLFGMILGVTAVQAALRRRGGER